MARQFLAVIFAFNLTACVPPVQLHPVEIDTGPKFTVSCYKDEFDAFERQIARRNCSVSANDFYFNASRPLNDTIARIDASGIRIGVQSYRSQGCFAAPRLMMSVDGKRIDTMSLAGQVAAMKSGNEFDYEVPNQYPYCNTRSYMTRLQGFAAAYDEMLQKWATMK